DHACLHPFIDERRAFTRMAHVAHLSYDLLAGSSLSKHTRLVDGPGERFLDISVLAKFHGRLGDPRVSMIGSRNEDRINILLLFKHLAEIGVALGFAIGF